jgi:Bacterial Ig domain
MVSKKRFPLFLAAFCMIVSACNLAGPQASAGPLSGPTAWIDAPLPGTEFRPPNPCLIAAHANDPQGIAQVELSLLNGEVLQTNPGPGAGTSLVSTNFSWTPPGPGTYNLQVRAQNVNGDWSAYAQTVVIFDDTQVTPTLPLTPVPAHQTSIERTSLSTNTVFYGLLGSLSVPCGEKSVTIRVKAFDPAGIKVVTLFYRLESQSSKTTTTFTPLAMTPIGQDTYQIVLTPQDLFNDSLVNLYGISWLQYQAVIQNNNGDTGTRTQVYSDLTLKGCTR